MIRRHLRSYNRIVLLHFLCEQRLTDIALVLRYGLYAVSFTLLHYRNKRAQSYSCRTEIIYLVYLQYGVHSAVALQYLLYLVCCDSVKSAAE